MYSRYTISYVLVLQLLHHRSPVYAVCVSIYSVRPFISNSSQILCVVFVCPYVSANLCVCLCIYSLGAVISHPSQISRVFVCMGVCAQVCVFKCVSVTILSYQKMTLIQELSCLLHRRSPESPSCARQQTSSLGSEQQPMTTNKHNSLQVSAHLPELVFIHYIFICKCIRICTCIPAPSLTWILQRQLRLFGQGSGYPGDSIVPRRSVKLPLQGTRMT